MHPQHRVGHVQHQKAEVSIHCPNYAFGNITHFLACWWTMFKNWLALKEFNVGRRYEPNRHLELDTVLLMLAQTGLYIYFAFSLLAGYLTQQIFKQPVVFLTSLVGLIQSSLQTLFIVDAWWRKCSTPQVHI